MPYNEMNFVQEYWPSQNARVKLENGRFIDVLNGCYFDRNVSVILEDGKIKFMPGLPGEPVDVRPDFTIDLKGKTVIPGLFNTHSHIQMVTPALLLNIRDIGRIKEYKEQQIAKSMTDCLAHGITNIRDALTENNSFNQILKNKISEGVMPGPRIYQAVLVSPIGGTFAPRHGPLGRLMFNFLGMSVVGYKNANSGIVVFSPDASEQIVRDAVDRAIDERGADCIKFYDQREKLINFKPGAAIMTFKQLEVAADQARRRNIKSTLHHLSVESFRRGVFAGVSSLAHVPCDTNLTFEDVEAFNGSDCMIEPTLSVAYYYCWSFKANSLNNHQRLKRLKDFRNNTYASIAKEYWIPELRNIFLKGMEKANRGKMRAFSFIDMSYLYQYFSKLVSCGMDNITMLFEYGASNRIGCANDGGAIHCSQAAIQPELEMFNFCLNNGLNEKRFDGADALRIATINSARALGLENKFGSIETGKIADLVIVDGDPLEDYRIIGSRVAALFMDGKLLINNCGLQL